MVGVASDHRCLNHFKISLRPYTPSCRVVNQVVRPSLASLLDDSRIFCQLESISRLVVNNLLDVCGSRNGFRLVIKVDIVDRQFAISWEFDAILRPILSDRVVLIVRQLLCNEILSTICLLLAGLTFQRLASNRIVGFGVNVDDRDVLRVSIIGNRPIDIQIRVIVVIGNGDCMLRLAGIVIVVASNRWRVNLSQRLSS